jgi:predicted glycosyltransferase
MIAFHTQYYRGLGHAMRVKYISDNLPANSFIMINQLFNPPIEYNTEYAYYLEEKPDKLENDYRFLMKKERARRRLVRLLDIFDKHPEITKLVCEGFPFCRQQFSYEYFSMFEECKKRDIQIIISVRDFPWDEPHYESLQDWVANTINQTILHYDCKILIHGDDKVMPLMADAIRNYQWSELEKPIKDKIIYTGYVCNPHIKPHKKENNNVYISCGLNKEEGFFIYSKILRNLSKKFPNLNFIVPLGDSELFSKIGSRASGNVNIVNYIPNLSKKLESCTAYITYGGYNSTTDILKARIPSIIIPRQDGHKLEQLIRCFKFEEYDWFKVCSYHSLFNIDKQLNSILEDSSFPRKTFINLDGADISARLIEDF